MKRYIKSSTIREYTGNVTFANYVGSDNQYTVNASSEEEAVDMIQKEAEDDLSVESIEEIDDNEYEVTISFASLVGIEETYTVYAKSEEQAEDMAMLDASGDLDVELVEG